ncbi:MAG: CDP-alcohol phosphatidyltransferase family protein [Mariprofundaceae bacterium]
MTGRILNIPNLLTLVRILLTPFIVYAILRDRSDLALALMAIAGLTDMLDGAIARLFDQKSVVGAYMDPLADKLMLVGAMVALFLVDRIPLFLFLAVVFRDVLIVLGAVAFELVTRRLEIRPSLISKATTLFQILLVLAVLARMAWDWPAPAVADGLVVVTFALTCVSGVHYLLAWTKKAITMERE